MHFLSRVYRGGLRLHRDPKSRAENGHSGATLGAEIEIQCSRPNWEKRTTQLTCSKLSRSLALGAGQKFVKFS
jgi:hypothetical protein